MIDLPDFQRFTDASSSKSLYVAYNWRAPKWDEEWGLEV